MIVYFFIYFSFILFALFLAKALHIGFIVCWLALGFQIFVVQVLLECFLFIFFVFSLVEHVSIVAISLRIPQLQAC